MQGNLRSTQEYTTAPVRAGAVVAPEFLDAEGVETCFGLKNSITYRLLAQRKIRGVSIRQPGRSRGKRLFDCASIRVFLNSNVDIEVDVDVDPEESEGGVLA